MLNKLIPNRALINSKYFFKNNMHFKCRNSVYPGSNGIVRTIVPDDKVEWNIFWEDYFPVKFTDSVLKGKPWADEEEADCVWNAIDGIVNRVSYTGNYKLFNKKPVNPNGRTGISGRGRLGRWGPNHAADPIVTRWLRENNRIIIHPISNLPILQFVAIQRRDCKEWAIPGGMVDAGEDVVSTLAREFSEEALNSLEKPNLNSGHLLKEITKLHTEVYRGYVDDPRNTDNAWMETVAVNFHDDNGSLVGQLPLQAGDDAQGVRWTNLGNDVKLYASHSELLHSVATLHKAHW